MRLAVLPALVLGVVAPEGAWAASRSDAGESACEAAGLPSLRARYEALERGPDDLAPALAEADRSLACLADPADASLAASAHRAHALAAWLGRDRDRVYGAWVAAVRAEPEWRPDPLVVPPGHPLDQLLAQARAQAAAPPEAVHLRAGEGLLVDGVRADALPVDAPAVVQRLRGGQVRATVYHWPGDPLPSLPSRLPRTAWIASASVGVASGVAWGLALRDLGAYRAGTERGGLDDDARAALADVGERANVLGGIATGGTALTVGFAALAVAASF